MILKRESILKSTLKLPSSIYGYDVITNSWFLILKMNGYLVASVYTDFMCLKSKNSSRQTDQVTWVDQRRVKVRSYEKQRLELKYHLLRRKYYYILKKVLHFRVSAVH